MMDPRDMAGAMPRLFENFDQKTMTCTVEVYDEEDDCSWEETVHMRFAVCGTCEGRGTHVNPNIDRGGIPGSAFAEDPDFAEDYWSGRYDVTCFECEGARVVPVPSKNNDPSVLARISDMIEGHHEMLSEMAAERRMGC